MRSLTTRIVAAALAGLTAAVGAAAPAAAAEFDLSGFVAGEVRVFPQDPAFRLQDPAILSPSVLLQPEFRVVLDESDDRLTLVPFFRYDADDRERTHFDLREANLLHDGGAWDLLLGVGKVFWGVVESWHLIDIVNQTDLVENPDQEEKLGQPMINVNLIGESGALGLFVLPGFRERTFPSSGARLRGALPIRIDDPVFESDLRRHQVAYAARWSQTVGDWDIGLSAFQGTGREPRLVPRTASDGSRTLVPHYDIIDQESVDLQLTRGRWLWKLEAMTRGGQGRRFGALVGGFEYTFFDVAGTGVDVGVLGEYLYDDRTGEAPATPFEDDVFAGLRLALNNVGSTAILAGGIVDRRSGATVLSIEAKHRLSDHWSVELEGLGFVGMPRDDPFFGIARDDFLQFRLVRYF